VKGREPDYAYLTTTGRRTGEPRTIEIWFAEDEGTVYLLSGGGDRSDWVRNLRRDPRVWVRLGGPRELRRDVEGTAEATAREVDDPGEESRVRRMMAAKYRGWREGQPLDDWAGKALLIALDPVSARR
jgi:deazaflavin-dependent oxidoreductase (nitroreductase family)